MDVGSSAQLYTALCMSQWGAGSIPANSSILEGNLLNVRFPDRFQDFTSDDDQKT